MTLEEIKLYIAGNDLDKLRSAFQLSKDTYFINTAFGLVNGATKPYYQADQDQYNPKKHDIHDPVKRNDKIINSETGTPEKIISVARLSIPEQKKIVLMAATFLGSPELSCNAESDVEKNMLAAVNTVTEDNKLDYKFKEISKITMSERECAELWYTQPADSDYYDGTALQGAKNKLRMRMLASSLGDTLYPVYDKFGDMVAFGRYYETTEFDTTIDQQKKVFHFDIYTKERFYFMQKEGNGSTWAEVKGEGSEAGYKNFVGKIPVVYYSQPATEWADVQEMIDRLEKKISNHADTNDYYDSPIVVAMGKVEGFANKGEQGKLLQAENGATVDYLTWDSAPESMKMEIDNLRTFIKFYTSTPDISLDNMKGIGPASGFSLKMLFMDAHLKASDKEDLFGQSVQRRINYLKSAIAIIKSELKAAVRLVIRPKFTYFLPKDVDGEVRTIVTAYQAGIISLETAVKLNPLVEDAVKELEAIKAEQAAKVKITIPPAPVNN